MKPTETNEKPNPSTRCRAVVLGRLAALLLAMPLCASAQWVTQTIALKAGWNAVYLHVDPSHQSLAESIGSDITNPIMEVWRWAPALSTLQFVQTPQAPVEGAQWASWDRNAVTDQLLQRLVGNSAYLIRVGTNVATYTWTVKGKPFPPAYEWTTTGLNFLGFPTVPVNAPTFESFLAKAPDLQQNAEVYQYPGGELGSGNPARVYAFRTVKVNRGQAYWIRAGTVFNQYFAPFEVVLSSTRGVGFGDSLNASSFRLRNLSPTNVTVTLKLVASETPPAGQAAIAGTPPLLVRGALNTTNLTYTYSNLVVNGTYSWTFAAKGQPGSEVEVVLGLNRVAMGGSVGDNFAGVLRLTDSFGHAQVEMPVTASAASSAGLWVGAATVTQVGQYLKSYNRNNQNNPVMDTNGQYVVTGLNTNIGTVARAYPLRLIVHNPEVGGGNAVLLQRAFVGMDPWTNGVVALSEASLGAPYLSQARRLSAAHLPWTGTNGCWSFNGALGVATNLSTVVTLNYDDQESNPFLHTYHPDHDNLDTSFKNQLGQGSESYTVTREIRLGVVPPEGESAAFTTSGKSVSGTYAETITVKGLARAGGTYDTRVFEVRGSFSLSRISSIPTLTRTASAQ